MKLIDAEALKKTMYHEAFEKDSDMQKWDSGCWIRYKMFENVIADAQPVNAIVIPENATNEQVLDTILPDFSMFLQTYVFTDEWLKKPYKQEG